MIKNTENIKLIHIGKCGGSTVSTILKNNNINFQLTHIEKANFDMNEKYVIVIRNPIKRFISSFNWRHKLVVQDKTQENRFKGEKEILQYYKTANHLAENIFDFDINKTYIHHIKEDIHFYLGNFLTKCKKENILGIITTENMNHDIKHLFGIDNTLYINKNSKNNTILSQLGYDNLTKYLEKDFECIHKLYSLGCLSKEQYDNLLNY